MTKITVTRESWHGRSSLLGALALQRRDAIPRKAAPDQPSSSPRSLRPHREAGRGPTRSPGASETLTQDSRSLSTRTVGRGRCSPGLIARLLPSEQTLPGARKTHLGFEYAVLLVDPEYHPLPTLDVAPTQGGLVALVKIVRGTGTPQFAPTGSLKFSGYDRVPLLESWQMEGLGL
jgi:hypothetical protein